MKKNVSGFTLVEVMIVVLIIALLATIAMPGLLRARINANDASAKASLKIISNALETYMSANDTYPPNVTSLLSVTPPYLPIDYFTGTHDGFTFTVDSLSSQLYSVTAAPTNSNMGSGSFTISTGAVLTAN